MHILMIPSWYPETPTDFSGSFFREQAATLIAAGHTVGVLAARVFPVYERGRTRAGRVPEHAVEDSVLVHRRDVVAPVPKMHRLNQRGIDAALRGMYAAYVADAGIPDVLHAHAMFHGGVSAAHLSRQADVPFVVTEHRPSSIERLREPGNRALGVRAAKSAGGLVAVTPGFAHSLTEAYGTEWNSVPGLLSPQFQEIDVRPVPPTPFTVSHVSHLDPGKRVDLLIEAFSDAFPSDTRARLRIVGGDENQVSVLRTVAARVGVTDRVDFIGAVARADIVAEFTHAHIFALTSEAESFGTVLWEAMASGVPVLSTDTWAGENAIRHGTGVLVRRNDRASVAKGLRQIRDEFGRYDSAEIRRLSLAHCGAAAFVAQYEDVYRKAMQ